jgi:uncharacterized protein
VGVLLLFLTVGLISQAMNFSFGAMFTEVFIFFAVPWIVLRMRGRDPRRDTGLLPVWWQGLGFGLALGVANFFAVVIPTQSLMQTVLPEKWLRAFDSSQIFKNLTSFELVLMVFSVGLLAPLCEELFFRGVLQPAWMRKARTPIRGIVWTAIVFSAFHLDPVGFLARIELGLLFGWLAWQTGNLWTGIGAHAGNNLISTALYLALSRGAKAEEEQSWGTVIALSVGGLAALAALFQLWRSWSVTHRLQAATPTTVASGRWSFSKAASPWILAGALSWVVLLGLDGRGVLLNVYDAAIYLPPPSKHGPDASAQARDELRSLRRKARRGEVPVADYLAQRRELARALKP